METFVETPNSEKHSYKPHVHMRRSPVYPSHNNVSSVSIMAARIHRQSTCNSIPRQEDIYRMQPTHNHKIDINQVPSLTTDFL
ncbi:unnamed protein product [Adineta steineri]|uniref:Uncharacterized protein n=1 Tax=Adineta steineri TaxID=433720 RepID=A0A819DVX8_9BILA|nr:unnamed protein product [Adineta steineri]CAF3840083.1 unnamed protein product [Adineta steineri]